MKTGSSNPKSLIPTILSRLRPLYPVEPPRRKVTPAQAHAKLEAMLKPNDVLAFHLLLITHGRQVCKAQRPLCGGCVLADLCPSKKNV